MRVFTAAISGVVGRVEHPAYSPQIVYPLNLKDTVYLQVFAANLRMYRRAYLSCRVQLLLLSNKETCDDH